jgi:hypothetical protein
LRRPRLAELPDPLLELVGFLALLRRGRARAPLELERDLGRFASVFSRR